MNSQIVTVNLVPGLSAPAVIRVSQYDVGRPLTIRVFDGTGAASFGASVTATIVGTKPSGLGFSVSGTLAGNTVTLNTTLAMTQELGMFPVEIRFAQTGEDIGTANFILAVEPSPHPEGTTDGTQETMANLETRLQGQIDDLDERVDAIEGDQSIIDDIDALDARVTALENSGSGLSSTEKQLILTLFSKAAYAEDDASTAYDALENLWTTTTRTITYNLSHVSSSNSTASIENGQSYTTTLTASANYTLNTVTVLMGGVNVTSQVYSSGTITIPSVTGNIVITATAVAAVSSISAVYTQSGTVYDTDSLDSLKSDLVVTATFMDSSTGVIDAADYTLSGTLAEGTSVVTVSYGGKTATFTVIVTGYIKFESVTDTQVLDRYNNASYPVLFTISNGNHVKIVNEEKSVYSNNYYLKVNISSLATNGQNAANVSDTIFTIPDGASVSLVLDNITGSSGYTSKIVLLYTSGGTNASGELATGTSGSIKTLTWTQSGDKAITCVGMNFTSTKAETVEFDVLLYVNDERWI